MLQQGAKLARSFRKRFRSFRKEQQSQGAPGRSATTASAATALLQAAATELQEGATLDTAGRCIDTRLYKLGAPFAQQEKKRNQKEAKGPPRQRKTAMESPQQSRKRERDTLERPSNNDKALAVSGLRGKNNYNNNCSPWHFE